MQCKTCGKANCYAHGGKVKLSKNHDDNEHLYKDDAGTSAQGSHVRSANRASSWAKDDRSSSPSIERSMAKESKGKARDAASNRLDKSRKLPKPKLQGLAHGGKVSDKEHMANVSAKQMELGKKHFKPLEGEAKEKNDKFWKDADHKLKRIEYAEGGEVDSLPDMDADSMGDDSELNDMVASELLDALENKDKKGILEAIKALVLSCGGAE